MLRGLCMWHKLGLLMQGTGSGQAAQPWPPCSLGQSCTLQMLVRTSFTSYRSTVAGAQQKCVDLQHMTLKLRKIADVQALVTQCR